MKTSLRYCKGQKMKDKKYQKFYEKWLADSGKEKNYYFESLVFKAPAKKKTATKRKASVRKKLWLNSYNFSGTIRNSPLQNK